jgi:uncharacterized protein (DUF934 family)
MTTPKQMICDKAVVKARYTLEESVTDAYQPTPDTAIPLDAWLSRMESGQTVDGLGVILEGDSDIEPLRDHLENLPFIALHLPKFTDGRVYSHAFRLRETWQFAGDILIYGDVLRDQLIYMSRCGINAFYLRSDQDPEASLAAFSLYTEYYQYN